MLRLLPLLLVSVQQAPNLSAPIPVDSQVIVGILSNGLRYYVRANRRPEKRAELRLVMNAGSILEDDDQLGLAHFTEHMAFNGTRRFARQELVRYLESIGMRFGPDINAYTSFDETVYMLQLPTDTGNLLERGFDILEDWAQGVTFDSAQVEGERGVVIEEWRLGRGAAARIRDRQFPVLFHGSRYAERLPIGRAEVLQSFRHDALRRFYREWYRPDLMAVVAVGDFDARRVEGLIRERFGRLATPANPRPRPTAALPPHEQTLVTVATDREATSSNVGVYFKQPLEEERTVGHHRRELVQALFNGMLNQRLFELTQRPGAPFVRAGSGQGRFVRGGAVYSLSAGVREGGIVRGLEGVLTEAERVARHGFTAGELDRQRARMLRGVERAYAERDRTESLIYANHLANAFLTGEPIPDAAWTLEVARALLPGITLQEVNGLARAWLAGRSRVVMASAPERESLVPPTEAQLLAVFDSVRVRPIEAYRDSSTNRPLVAQVPEPSRIVEERAIAEIGVTEWRLANGVRVVLKPTDFKNDEILLGSFSPGGTSLTPDSLALQAQLASALVSLGGVGEFSVTDLRRVLAGKAAGAQPSIGLLTEGINGNASPQDVETMFQLVYLYFTAPRRDSVAFAAWRERTAAQLANRGASPIQAFFDTVTATMAQGHPRSRPLTAERLPEVRLDRVLAIYRDRFADASDFTFVIVGAFQPDSLRPLVQRYLGGLPSLGRRERWRDVGGRPPSGVVEKAVRRGVEPQSRTQIIFTGPAEASLENRYAIRSLAELMQMRLRDRLRDQLGGTYSANVGASISRDPRPEYGFSVSFGAAPERLDSLVSVVFGELQRVRDSLPTTQEIATLQETQRRGRETNLRENGYWLGQLLSYYREEIDPRLMLGFERRIDGLTGETIRQAAGRYLRMDQYVRVSLYPER